MKPGTIPIIIPDILANTCSPPFLQAPSSPSQPSGLHVKEGEMVGILPRRFSVGVVDF